MDHCHGRQIVTFFHREGSFATSIKLTGGSPLQWLTCLRNSRGKLALAEEIVNLSLRVKSIFCHQSNLKVLNKHEYDQVFAFTGGQTFSHKCKRQLMCSTVCIFVSSIENYGVAWPDQWNRLELIFITMFPHYGIYRLVTISCHFGQNKIRRHQHTCTN